MEVGSFAELKEAGERHYFAGEFAEAAKCYRKAADLVPTSADVWVRLGAAYAEIGNYPDAVSAYRSAIGLDPHNVDALYGIGKVYVSNADFARAVTSFDQVLEIRPNHALAKDELVRTLLRDGKIKSGSNDHYGAEASLERAYKLARTDAETVLPYVEHLIGSNQHKKAFDVINQARREVPGDGRIKALGERMDNDPKLAHAKTITTLRTEQKPGLAAPPPKPAVNPDEVPCPCGATRVMKWAVVCPTCNNRIGNMPSQFAGQQHVSATTWIDVAYYIISVLWLLSGVGLILLGVLAGFGDFFTIVGIANAAVALGLLFQVEWLQYIARILMLLNVLGGIIQAFMSLGLSNFIGVVVWGAYIALSGFSMWIIGQMSD